MKNNLFSKHDNRHTLQHCGEYFGQGLGKQRLESSNQHRSSNHMSWLDNQTTYCSTYKQGYSKHRRSLSAGPESSRNTDEYLLNKFHVLTKPTFRRFPRHHTLPGTTFRPEDLVSTTLWQQTGQLQTSRESAYSTPLSILAATQQPVLQHSRSWQYSYKQ